MIALIQFLIFGHFHKWVTISTANFYEARDAGKPGALPTGAVYIQQCGKCGKVVRRDLH